MTDGHRSLWSSRNYGTIRGALNSASTCSADRSACGDHRRLAQCRAVPPSSVSEKLAAMRIAAFADNGVICFLSSSLTGPVRSYVASPLKPFMFAPVGLVPACLVPGGLLACGLAPGGLAPGGVVPGLVPPCPVGLTRFLPLGCWR